jgi:hypothetical protein
MNILKSAPLALAATLLAASGTAVAQDATPNINPAGLPFNAGVYRCELNRSVHVRHVAPDLMSAVLHWEKKDYQMKAIATPTGALRYEHEPSGLVWLVIVGKSILLDTKAGRQLANDCKA